VIGTQLGHYRLTALLGEGGMGRVFAAEDLRLGRRVALKLLPESLQGDPAHLERFQREARLLAAVNHPNVITVHSVEEADGHAFITMELVDGGTLLDRIRPGGLALEELLGITIPLAEALAAAHAMGIVHRDLKPANVMLGRDGRLKVVDFGIAKPDRSQSSASTQAPLTGAGLVLGTPAYMAPEQLKGEAIDQRVDIFALAVVIYELATGTRPFGGRSDADVVSAILRDLPPPLQRQRADLPAQLQSILASCFEKEPARRTDSAATIARALANLRRPDLTPPPTPSQPRRAEPAISAIAVLPLQETGAQSDDLLADGITEALIADLARASGLKVISRSSVMRFRDSDLSPQEIARKLGVDALVMGSVRRSGNRIRISVELIDPESERVLWADRYDRELEDVLRLQDEMARAIAEGVNARVSQGDTPSAPMPRQVDPEVYMLDLKGRSQIELRTPSNFRAALTHFREALARDPSYGPSWIGIVRARNMQLNYGLEDPLAVRAEMEAALSRARECAADPAEVLAEHAQMHWQCDYDWVTADAEFCRALELAPNNARVWYWRGICAGGGGNHAASFEYLARAESLDPLSYFIRVARALLMYYANRIPEAIAHLHEVLQLAPDQVTGFWILGMSQAAAGEFEASIENSERAAQHLGRLGRALAYLGYAYARSGRVDAARAVLSELEHRPGQYMPPYFAAVVLQGLGETDAALARLSRARDGRDSMLRDLRVDRVWDSLRDDPRFIALSSEMRFPGDLSGPTRKIGSE
jgi:serine/threonine protein kinase/tetratricopeptide (TPR) repeat protein